RRTTSGRDKRSFACSGRSVRTRLAEVDAHWPARSRLFDIEELSLLEVEHSGDDIRRKLLDAGVQEHDLIVVELPRERDLGFGSAELFLQGKEVLVGLEVRVGLGDREQTLQGAGDLVLGRSLLV